MQKPWLQEVVLVILHWRASFKVVIYVSRIFQGVYEDWEVKHISIVGYDNNLGDTGVLRDIFLHQDTKILYVQNTIFYLIWKKRPANLNIINSA